MKFTIITLFPEMFEQILGTSMMWKAQEKKLAEFELVNLRDFGLGPRRGVDDTPYGGGDGMLLRVEPIFAAVESIKEQSPTVETILMTPKGTLWSQKLARSFAKNAEPYSRAAVEGDFSGARTQTVSEANLPNHFSEDFVKSPARTATYIPDGTEGFATYVAVPSDAQRMRSPAETGSEEKSVRKFANQPHYILICPHYEGYDERILELVDHQISIGHYILTGGELPAMVVIDSIVRLLPGVLGGETSAEIESFSDDTNLEYPQYTRPENFRGMKVPDVLLSGHHGEISKWREAQSGSITPTL